jgi:tRNA threonylcarbamoyladenosine biosynthesis protein TsaE
MKGALAAFLPVSWMRRSSRKSRRKRKKRKVIVELHSPDPEETLNIGRNLGVQLRGKELILLSGDLGVGKTLFTKGIAAALGIDPAEVVSPTFTLMNIFEGKKTKLFHIDLYRLAEEMVPNLAEIDDFLDSGIIVVEWAQYLSSIYSKLAQAINIEISIRNGDRLFKISTDLDYLLLT